MTMRRRSNRKRPFITIAISLVLLPSLSLASATFTTATDVDTDHNNDDNQIHTSIEEELDSDLWDENIDSRHEPEQPQHAGKDHGHWGTKPATSSPANNSNSNTHTFIKNKSDKEKSKHSITHKPPDSFTLAARISQTPKGSCFQVETLDEPVPSIPFYECNSVGTTTPPISSASVSFRNFPNGAHPELYTFTRGFIVPLSKIEIEVQTTQMMGANAGDGDGATADENKKRIFNAGEVIWVDGEYRMSSADGGKDLSALIVNVPKKTTGMSRDLFGLPKILNCNDDATGVRSLARNVRGVVSARRVILASIGLTFSSMMTYFWIKVAPLQLAVGIGGACMIGGGTLAMVMGGEIVCDEIKGYVQKARQEREREQSQEVDVGYFEEEEAREEQIHVAEMEDVGVL